MRSRIPGEGLKAAKAITSVQRVVPPPTRLRVEMPWGGLVQAVNQEVLNQGAFQTCVGLVPSGERLAPNYGWIRYQNTDNPVVNPLPLGGVGHTFGTDPGQPVMALARLRPLASQSETVLAMTAHLSGTDGTMFRFVPSTGYWEEVTGAPNVTTTEDRVFSHTIYPFATNWGSGRLGIAVFTNGVGTGGRVWMYPGALATYLELPVPAAMATFQAQSVTTYNEALHFLNTSEGGVHRPQRVRRTIQGWGTAVAANFTDPGSGAMDLIEFSGRGLKLLPLGNRLAAYFEDGVAILDRTDSVEVPYKRHYSSRRRGLLGPNCVIELNPRQHFGVFTDGFFIFDESENWSEVGIVEVGGVRVSKFGDFFLRTVNQNYRHRVSVGLDDRRDFVYISYPSTASTTGRPDSLLIYDVRGDRFFNDQVLIYPAPTVNRAPFCFNTSIRIEQSFVWLINNPWESYNQNYNNNDTIHGTFDGMVYQHSPLTWQRDGGAYFYTLSTHPFSFGDPYRNKTMLSRSLLYDPQSASQTVALIIQDATNNVNLYNQNATLLTSFTRSRVVRWHPHVTASAFKFSLSGEHPALFLGWEDEFVPSSVGEEY